MDKTIHIPVFDAEKIPVFTALLCHIRIRYKMEKHISIKKNKTSSFSTMWSVWKAVGCLDFYVSMVIYIYLYLFFFLFFFLNEY